MKKRKLDRIESEYSKSFSFYLDALKSRREYLTWFTIFFSLIITITAFLWKYKYTDLALLVILLSIFTSIPVLNVLVGTSKTIIYLLERNYNIQKCINKEFPTLNKIIPSYSNEALTIKEKYSRIPFFRLKIGYILTILITFISVDLSIFTGLLISELQLRPLYFWIWTLISFFMVLIILRIYVVNSLGHFINNLKFPKNEKKKNSNRKKGNESD